MLSRVRNRLSYANVMASIAVFFALGGAAYAVTAIDDNSVRSRHIVNGQVKTPDLRDNAVRTGKIANGTITGADVGNNRLKGADIDEGSLDLPAAKVSQSVDQFVPSHGGSFVFFNREHYDTANMHSNSLNNTRIVAPVDGIYAVTAHVSWRDSTEPGGVRRVTIFELGTPRASDTRNAAGSLVTTQTVTTHLSLDAGDYVRAEVYQSSGTNLFLEANIATSPTLAMVWVAPGPQGSAAETPILFRRARPRWVYLAGPRG